MLFEIRIYGRNVILKIIGNRLFFFFLRLIVKFYFYFIKLFLAYQIAHTSVNTNWLKVSVEDEMQISAWLIELGKDTEGMQE